MAARYGRLGAGLGLHAVAVHLGSLTVVQPLLVAGILFSLPASRWATGRPISRGDMAWAALLVAALAVFLVSATPIHQSSTSHTDTGPALAVLALSLLGVTVCLALSRRTAGSARAATLGAAAGVALAGSAALMKVVTDVATRGAVDLLTGWPFYAFLAVGAVGLLLTQLSYRAGPMTSSLPAINTVNPMASLIIGWAVFDEQIRTGAGAVGIEVPSMIVVVWAVLVLSRRSAVRPDPAPGRPFPAVAPGPPALDTPRERC